MEQNELLEIKKQVLDEDKKGNLCTFDGKLHIFNPGELIEKTKLKDLLKELHRDKDTILKISEKNPRWVNDYALITILETLYSKWKYSEDNIEIINKDVDLLKNENTVLIDKLNNAQKIIKDLNNKIEEYEKEKLINESNKASEQNTINALNEKVVELESIISECTAKLNAAEEDNKSTYKEYTKVKNKLENLRQSSSETIEKLNGKISDLNNEIYEYADTISKINNSIKPVSTKAEKYNSKRIGTNFESGPNIGV